MLRILVFGAGAIGVFLGTKLFAAGYDVVLYGGRKLDRLTDPIWINQSVYALPPKLADLAPADYNIIFVTTKLYDVPRALADLRKHRFNPQILAFIQNGIVEPDFYGEFKQHPGFLTLSAYNGYHLTGNQILVAPSELGFQIEDTGIGKQVQQLLSSAQIHCATTPNIDQLRAKKLIFNSAVNALSAIEQQSYGNLISNPQFRQIIDGILQEGWQILGDDYHLPPLELLKQEIYRLTQQVSNHYSSMYQDLVSGRNTEIEFLNGFLIKLGKVKGIPTPYNQLVYSQLLEKMCGLTSCTI
jgi:2-dehydropantoate 2-reductase